MSTIRKIRYRGDCMEGRGLPPSGTAVYDEQLQPRVLDLVVCEHPLGAPLSLGATKCEYCGMFYEPDYWAGTVKYVPIHTGRRQLRAKAKVDDYLMAGADKDAVARYVRGDLVNQLAAGVAEMMNLRMHHDPCAMVTIVEGEVWVEEPDRRTAFFGMEGY